jgi:hypothetical protein
MRPSHTGIRSADGAARRWSKRVGNNLRSPGQRHNSSCPGLNHLFEGHEEISGPSPAGSYTPVKFPRFVNLFPIWQRLIIAVFLSPR